LELRRLRSKWRSNTWTKIKVSCLHSLTIAWGYCLAVVSVVMQGGGRILLGVSIITIVAQLRTARKVN